MELQDLAIEPPKKRALVKRNTSDKSSIITPQSTPSTTPQHLHITSFMDSDEEFNSSMSTEEDFMEDEDSDLSSGDGKVAIPYQFFCFCFCFCFCSWC